MLMTAAAGAGAIVGFLCALLRVGERHGREVYRGWLRFAAIVILFLSIWIFRSVYAWVWETFPNGYQIASQVARTQFGDSSHCPDMVRSRKASFLVARTVGCGTMWKTWNGWTREES